MLRKVKSVEALKETLRNYTKTAGLYRSDAYFCFSDNMFKLCGTVVDINEDDPDHINFPKHLYLRNRTPQITYVVEEWLVPQTLAEKRGISEENIRQIKILHKLRDDIHQIMRHCPTHKLPIFDKQCTQIDYDLQRLWGFDRDERFHRYWERPRCQCPSMDNDDAYPHGYYTINGDCPLHGQYAKDNVTREISRSDILCDVKNDKPSRAEIIKRLRDKFDVISVYTESRKSPECSIDGKQIKASVRYSPKFELTQMEERVTEFKSFLGEYNMTIKVRTSKYHTYIQVYNFKED